MINLEDLLTIVGAIFFVILLLLLLAWLTGIPVVEFFIVAK